MNVGKCNLSETDQFIKQDHLEPFDIMLNHIQLETQKAMNMLLH